MKTHPKSTSILLLAAIALLGLCVDSRNLEFGRSDSNPDFIEPLADDSQNKILDKIFEEEKSDHVCRFLKSKKMKA